MMVASQPGSPEPVKSIRLQNTFSATTSPDKQRVQGSPFRPVRSASRLSQSSKQGITRNEEEGKVAVNVVVRVRPPLGPSDPGYDLIPQRFQKSVVQITAPTSLGVDSPQGRKLFIFDRVFGEESSQKGVWEYLHDSVESFLQGYNVSILAYGQSGAGKSFTMGTSGPTEQKDPSLKGVIPRAAQYLFENLEDAPTNHSRQNSGLKSPTRFSVNSMNQILQNNKTTSDKGWEMSVTYVEIYNEQPRDLLLPESTPNSERPNVQIREDPKGRIFVEGLKSVPVTSIDELMTVLNHGSTIRQTDATTLNARSSRSHAVFTINLKQTKPQASPTREVNGAESTVTVESKLHFVDLAGSERLKNTGAIGDRAREGISINAGLASLGKVISQLSSRSGSSYVSYRDSKLTRMLQDSLGGNAITYMIACVTPAEFHLSETLNTVQYAQRARNIQSKPRIQQINDDADKQAVIDRLRSEIAFLRQQTRGSEGGDRRSGPLFDRMDRPNERENDLQNQLLDVQERYQSLSQRHAKLIGELTTDENSEQVQLSTDGNAVDRLKRSQDNQQMIEQMVLEYEKTIQALEASLSNSRSNLATVETSLLEKDTKFAYVETMNQQLNSRVQKMMDREANTEQYLHDLEARLEDKSTGDEKNDAIVSDLRKEIARIRENESNSEDYICTLEERLAEADQDMEIMQREVERLEHLVERQRSLGKLDNLLYELDHFQRKGSKSENPPTNGVNGYDESFTKAKQISLPEDDEGDVNEGDANRDGQEAPESDAIHLDKLEKATARLSQQAIDNTIPSPAQSKFVVEKFETVSQELFDLRLEHENTVNELDLMSAKYQEALRTLAEMQDSFDESRQSNPRSSVRSPDSQWGPGAFLEDARTLELRNGGHLSSSRSLSSELSLAGESPASTDTDITPVSKQPVSGEVAVHEVERLQALVSEHERGMSAVTQQYAKLQAEHKDALEAVERLKIDNARNRPASPSTMPGMLRRMASQPTAVDRGQRSIVSLRALIAEELDSKPDRLETAEVHLTAANHELQTRLERIQALENEVKNAKKEMEMKSTIISGLTRERNSMKAGSPVDLSMVSQMRDQLIQKETELKSLHEGYAKREEELQTEIQSLSSEKSRISSPGPHSPANDERIISLEEQLATLRGKHKAAEESVQEISKQHSLTKSELGAALASIATLRSQHHNSNGDSNFERAATATAMQRERDNYHDLIDNLKKELHDERTHNMTQKDKIIELGELHTMVSKDALDLSDKLKAKENELKQLESRVAEIEVSVKEAQVATETQKNTLQSLRDTHATEIEEMKLAHAGHLAHYDDELAEMTKKHEKTLASNDPSGNLSIVDSLLRTADSTFDQPTTTDQLAVRFRELADQKRELSEENSSLKSTNATLERQLGGGSNVQDLEKALETSNKKISAHQETIKKLADEIGNHEESIRENSKTIKKHESTIAALEDERKKKSAIIEELEQQLQNSFDQHHNRVSVIQAQGNQALVEAQHRILSLEQEVDQRRSVNDPEPGSRAATMKSLVRPQSPLAGDPRSNSLSSNLRKSASIASLPSPPPAIPLPPLPSLPALTVGPANNPSPPQSRHTSKEVSIPATPNSATIGNNHGMRRHSALIEEQESRLRTIEKHLHAEKQLTATLEEALVDLETQSNKLRADAEGWKKKAWAMEEELANFRKEKKSERLSVQAVEEEVKRRREAEAARAQLEERMRLLTAGQDGKKKTKKASLNCF